MTANKQLDTVLLIDDQASAILWMKSFLDSLGYKIEQRLTESAGRDELERISKGEARFAAAIIDVMVPTHSFEEILDFDDEFLEESRNSGIRLCKKARRELGISEEDLPIVCISARSDQALLDELHKIGIPFFSRTDQGIRNHLRELLASHPNSTSSTAE